MKTYLEGGRERDGRQCEGTAAEGGSESENGAGDLTHLVKVKHKIGADPK